MGYISIIILGALVGILLGNSNKKKNSNDTLLYAGLGAIGSLVVGWLVGNQLLQGNIQDFFEFRTWITGAIGAAAAVYGYDMMGKNKNNQNTLR